MSIFKVSNIRIAGISACVPKSEFNNNDYDWLNKKERETLIKTIGVERKRHASKGTTTADLCEVAIKDLMSGLDWEYSEVDLLVLVSQSRDYLLPASAGILQDKLNFSKNCMAFDISLGCSGYAYGLSVVGSLMSTGAAKKAIFLTGDISTQTTSYRDKSSYPLFGDAGTATAIEFDTNASDMYFNLQTDGGGYEAIIIPDGGMRHMVDEKTSFIDENIEEGIIRSRFNIALDGIKIFTFSLKEVRPNILKLLKENDIDINSIDYFVFHQANKLMNETIRKQLKLPEAKVPYSLWEYGNTSSASIPLTIVNNLAERVKNGKNHVLMSGFGVGLSWGSVIAEINNIVCPPIAIYEDSI